MQYTLIRAHKRTLSLQVSSSGDVIVRAPYLMPKFFIDKFVKEKSGWVEKRLKEMAKPLEPKVEHFTESKLKKFIEGEVKKYSTLMGLHPLGLRFTHVHTYWGTCAPSGILSFNLELCFTPDSAVTYVVVHELAHLRWRGHGKRFWEMVNKYYPDTPLAKKFLRSIHHL
jgi:predicted metal-dependent hydrolase